MTKKEEAKSLIEFYADEIKRQTKIVAQAIYDAYVVPFMKKYKLKIRYAMGGVYFVDQKGNGWVPWIAMDDYKKCVDNLFDEIELLCNNFPPLSADRNSSIWKIVGWHVIPKEEV